MGNGFDRMRKDNETMNLGKENCKYKFYLIYSSNHYKRKFSLTPEEFNNE